MAGTIVVVGAGAWGTALAIVLARNAHRSRLMVRRSEMRQEMIRARENCTYLAGVALPANVELADASPNTLADASVIVMAIPSRFARATMSQIAPAISRQSIIVSATKGIEESSLMTMTAMLSEIVPSARAYVALSGPGFAAEVARGKPAALVIASKEEDVAREVQHLFAGPMLRVYRSDDVTGVELAGAAKNVIAIAAGISDGLDLGASARAAVITRGLAEIARLVSAAGGKRETVMGLAGLGDLVLTCTGDLSRNRSLGLKISREGGFKLPTSEPGTPIAEGIVNARTFKLLSERHQIEMPIVNAVYRTLYEAEPPKAMVDELLSRALKSEF